MKISRKKEEQITSPGLDTELGQIGDKFISAIEDLDLAERNTESSKQELLEQMEKEGQDKIVLHGSGFKMIVRAEYVESHSKLRCLKKAETLREDA